MAPSEIFHVFDQRLLVLIAKVSPKGMSAILDEVRAETDFQHFFMHTLKRRIVVLGLKFGELLFRRALQDPVHIGLHNCLKVFRVDVHDEVYWGPFRNPQQAHIQAGETNSGSCWVTADGGSALSSVVTLIGFDAEALLRPEKLCHAIFVGRHAAGDGGVAGVNTEGVIMQIRRCGPNANKRRRAIEGCREPRT